MGINGKYRCKYLNRRNKSVKSPSLIAKKSGLWCETEWGESVRPETQKKQRGKWRDKIPMSFPFVLFPGYLNQAVLLVRTIMNANAESHEQDLFSQHEKLMMAVKFWTPTLACWPDAEGRGEQERERCNLGTCERQSVRNSAQLCKHIVARRFHCR